MSHFVIERGGDGMGYHGFGKTPRHQRGSDKADEKRLEALMLPPCRWQPAYHIWVKSSISIRLLAVFSRFLALDEDLTGILRWLFTPVYACKSIQGKV